MPKFFVEYHKRDSGYGVVDADAVRSYCNIQGQNYGRVTEVLESCPRVEYYVRNSEGMAVAVFYIMHTLDMHHGPVAMFAADWVHPLYRRIKEIHKLRMWYLKRFCSTYNVTKYQRSKHISPTAQVQITKEV